MHRCVCTDTEVLRAAESAVRASPLHEGDVELYQLSNGPSFSEAFELSLVSSPEALRAFLDERPASLIDPVTGVLSDLYTNELVLESVEPAADQLELSRKYYAFEKIYTVGGKQCYFPRGIDLASLGQVLRYSTPLLSDEMRKEAVTDALGLVAKAHESGSCLGPCLNVDCAGLDFLHPGLRLRLQDEKYVHVAPKNLNFTHLWLLDKLDSFDYLRVINFLAGRRPSVFCAPFFPWVRDFATNEIRDPNKSQFSINKG